ncbi:MAG TPA: hypothetical protein VEK73_10095 [Xanthobacteraceae bacterium]|nr:hypothetical protein [Xanthobacteraceae bacterium]
MVDDAIKPALRAALRCNEIGDESPYQISFAGKGNSGASFGFMQGDMAVQPIARDTFRAALTAAGFDPTRINSLVAELSQHLSSNPLSQSDTQAINAALAASSALVDSMDETILTGVYNSLDQCTAAAQGGGCTIQPVALIYMAQWINMTGPPTSLKTWLGGGNPGLGASVPRAAPSVGETAIQAYLRATKYFKENPKNLTNFIKCAQNGAKSLPPSSPLTS